MVSVMHTCKVFSSNKKNCLVDFDYLEKSQNYESVVSGTLRWLLYIFKIICISFPKVFLSLYAL